MLAFVEVLYPDGRQERHELTKKYVTFGRSKQADIYIEDASVSRLHARMEQRSSGSWCVADMGSTNGLTFDGSRIHSLELRQGDVIQIGAVQVAYHGSGVPREDSAGHGVNQGTADETIAVASQPEASRDGQRAQGEHGRLSVGGEAMASTSGSRNPDAGIRSFSGAALPASAQAGSGGLPVSLLEEPDDQEVGLLQQLQPVGRYKFTFLAVFLLAAASSIAGVWLFVIPTYMAVAQIHVRPFIPPVMFSTDENGLIPRYDSYLRTQVDKVQSPTVIQRALDQPEVQATEFYKAALAELGEGESLLVPRIREGLEAETTPRSEVIQVSLSLENPRDAVTILNELVDQYLAYDKESMEAAEVRRLGKLNEEAKSLLNQIELKEKELDRIRREMGTTVEDELISQKRLRIDEMEATSRRLKAEIEAKQKQLQAMRASAGEEDSGVDRQNAPRFEADAQWRQHHERAAALKQELAAERQQLGERHPVILQLKERLKVTQANIAEREEEISKTPRTIVDAVPSRKGSTTDLEVTPESVARAIEELKNELTLVLRQIEEDRKELDDLLDSTGTLSKLREGITRLRERYDRVQARLYQKSIEQSAPGSIEVLSRASVAGVEEDDKRLKLSVVCLVGAFGMGIALSLVRARTTQRFDSVGDLPHGGLAPFLGQLPLAEEMSEGFDPTESPALVESVRMLRTVLLQRLAGDRSSVVMITGAGAGCGKTTFAILMAKSLARCGKRVLLIEADLRKPSLSTKLRISGQVGLTGCLSQDVSPSEAIVAMDAPRFSVLPAGEQADLTGLEALANGVFESCLAQWRQEYDIILLDTPPVFPVADASILSRHADGTIMVVRQGVCRRVEVADAYQDLLRSGARLLGTVFVGSGGYGRYGTSYTGYGYGG